MVETGYKYRFFGADATAAARALSIYAVGRGPKASASVPTYRVLVHARRLALAGFRVGIVRQAETAALKRASKTNSSIFERRMAEMVSRSTVRSLDEVTLPDAADAGAAASPGDGAEAAVPDGPSEDSVSSVLLSVGVAGSGSQRCLGLCIVDTACSRVETRALSGRGAAQALKAAVGAWEPAEVLLPAEAAPEVEAAVQAALGDTAQQGGAGAGQLPPAPVPDERCALHVPGDGPEPVLWGGVPVRRVAHSACGGATLPAALVDAVARLSAAERAAYSAAHAFLTDCKAALVMGAPPSRPEPGSDDGTAPRTATVDALTLESLEVFRASGARSNRGSLMWAVDDTRTRSGTALLRRWLERPLADAAAVTARLDAVAVLRSGQGAALAEQADPLLRRLPDLAAAASALHRDVVQPKALLAFLQGVRDARQLVDLARAPAAASPALTAAVRLPGPGGDGGDVCAHLVALDADACTANDALRALREEARPPEQLAADAEVVAAEEALAGMLPPIASALGVPSLQYRELRGGGAGSMEYLVEVSHQVARRAPKDWPKLSSTKQVVRFRPPQVEAGLERLLRARERRDAAARDAVDTLARTIAAGAGALTQLADAVAALDVLLAFARVASRPGYSRPLVEEAPADGRGWLRLREGRHPVADLLSTQPFVPNDCELGGEGERARVVALTGPNMGGKSSYVRTVASLVLLAQAGCHVPAASFALTPVDAVLARVGAASTGDPEEEAGKSTFLAEMERAQQVVAAASPRSFVALDELGRGTATHDGAAIARATLRHLALRTGCLGFFITHYPAVAALARSYPRLIRAAHMDFTFDTQRRVVFLYKAVDGAADSSYGLQVARLAGLPEHVIARAHAAKHGAPTTAAS